MSDDWGRRLGDMNGGPAPRVDQDGGRAARRQPTAAEALVRTMQEALLPGGLPVLPRLETAAGYLFATSPVDAGGDWFDVVVRPDGRVALLLGDVVGDGAVAAATMGRLSAVCHERFSGTATFVEALEAVDRFARLVPDARHATMSIVEIDTATGRGRYCTLGHPPPLVLASGTPRRLAPTGAGPLATSGRFPVHGFELPSVGDLVVLSSSRIHEHRRATPSTGPEELEAGLERAVAGAGPDRHLGEVCRRTLEAMARSGGHDDDIAVLAARRTGEPEPLRLRLPAVAASLAEARDVLARWLDDLGVGQPDRLAVVHAASELLANVVVHAYEGRPDPGAMTLAADLRSDARLDVVVTDQGAWRSPARVPVDPHATGGRGLRMADALLDSLEIDHADAGTTATGTLRLRRPPAFFTASSSALAPDHATGEPSIDVAHRDGTIVVRGAVLGGHADELEQEIRNATVAGTVPVTVDLAGVTQLGGAAVRVLHDLITSARHDITLVAPPGTVAQQVLDLVQLRHRPDLPGPPDDAGDRPASQDGWPDQ